MSIAGLVPYNDVTSPLTVLGVSPGQARDYIADAEIKLAASMRKSISAVWGAGDGFGGLDTLSARLASGTLFVHVIGNLTITDVLLSASASNPIMPSGFTWRRRVGAVLLDASANVTPALWRPDGTVDFMAPIRMPNTNPIDPGALILPVPVGLKVRPKLFVVPWPNAAGYYMLLRDPDLVPPPNYADDPVTFYSEACVYSPANVVTASIIDHVWTDMNAKLLYGVGPTASGIVGIIIVQGWFDPREPL